jgi:hypothetical protein
MGIIATAVISMEMIEEFWELVIWTSIRGIICGTTPKEAK